MTQETVDPNLLLALLACEEQVWTALKRGDAEADAALLLPEFLGVYPDGFSDRAGHAGQLESGPAITSYRLSRARVLPVGHAHALLSYKAIFTRMDQTETEEMYVSSLWQRDGAGWRNLFSQDTPAREPDASA